MLLKKAPKIGKRCGENNFCFLNRIDITYGYLNVTTHYSLPTFIIKFYSESGTLVNVTYFITALVA